MLRLTLVFLVLFTGPAMAYSIILSNIKITAGPEPDVYGYEYDWKLDASGGSESDRTYCPNSLQTCFAGIYPLINGMGPSNSWIHGPGAVALDPGTSVEGVYLGWKSYRGWSGHVSVPPSRGAWPWGADTPEWSSLCFGFAGHVGDAPNWLLIPGSHCYRGSPPENTCRLELPSSIDLGVVNVGHTAQGSGRGNISCNRVVSVRARLLNRPVLDGVAVQISLNGHTLHQGETTVGTGDSLALRVSASVYSSLMHPGVYYTDSIISVSYD